MADGSEGVNEVLLGDYVLRLDGTVLEVLHRTGISHRFHVNHVAVEAKPHGEGLRINVGVDQSGVVIDGTRIDVPADQVSAVTTLFDQAKAARHAD